MVSIYLFMIGDSPHTDIVKRLRFDGLAPFGVEVITIL